MANQKEINVHKVSGWGYDLVSKNNPLDNGELTFKFGESAWETAKSQVVSFPLISVWLDPNRANTICKAHAAIPQKPQTEEQEAALLFAKTILKSRGTSYNLSDNNYLICSDDYLKIIRYGVDTRNGEKYFSRSNDDLHRSERVPVFESKGDALVALLEAVSEVSSAKLTGIDIINLGAASDGLLLELGFSKIEDRLGHGIPMWVGDPVKAINPDSSYSNTRYYTYSEERKARQDVVEQFLNLVEKELAA